jgi:hypothetical protein
MEEEGGSQEVKRMTRRGRGQDPRHSPSNPHPPVPLPTAHTVNPSIGQSIRQLTDTRRTVI